MKRNMRGFTIYELMIVVAIAAILVGIGVPTFQATVKNNRMTSNLNAFVTSLNQARSEAVKQNLPVRVCASSDGTTCGGAGVNWEQGWVVFVDRDNDGVIDDGNDCDNNATDDCIITVQSELHGEIQLRSTVNSISYFGSGTSNGADTFTICDSRGADHAKAVVVSSTGRPSISKKEADGTALSCPA